MKPHYRSLPRLLSIAAVSSAAISTAEQREVAERADMMSANAVIHTKDSIRQSPSPNNTMYHILKRVGNFKTIVKIVDDLGLNGLIKGNTPITLFAPTDEAFKSLPMGAVEKLFGDSTDNMWYVLVQHIIKGRVSARDAWKTGAAKAIYGDDLKFSSHFGTFQVNGATILTSNIRCDNGIIHVIDKVMLPSVHAPYAKAS